MKILITGVAGFLGSNLCKRLLDDNHTVYGVDNLSAGEIVFLPISFQDKICIDDFASKYVLGAIKAKTYDVVIHCAAQPRVQYSVENPSETNETNVSKTVQLLDACRNNIKRFINISSSAVYGNVSSLDIPTTENTKHNPQSPYALQKSIIESYCKLFNSLYGLDVVSIRPFNIYGPNQRGTSPYSTVVSAWLQAIKDGKAIRFDGSGLQERDMIYVDNVVDIITHCVKYPKVFNAEAFNAGTGNSISNIEILKLFQKHFPNIKINYAPVREGDVMKTQADIFKVMDRFEYTPSIFFKDGFELTKEWMLK